MKRYSKRKLPCLDKKLDKAVTKISRITGKGAK